MALASRGTRRHRRRKVRRYRLLPIKSALESSRVQALMSVEAVEAVGQQDYIGGRSGHQQLRIDLNIRAGLCLCGTTNPVTRRHAPPTPGQSEHNRLYARARLTGNSVSPPLWGSGQQFIIYSGVLCPIRRSATPWISRRVTSVRRFRSYSPRSGCRSYLGACSTRQSTGGHTSDGRGSR